MVACPQLASLPVLVVDCQTTGASPERGHLLELAWAAVRADDANAPHVESAFVALPEGSRVPPRVSALTGIFDVDLAGAEAPARVWEGLRAAAAKLALGGGGGSTVAVAHFARFERAFLEALHREHGGGVPFPLDLVCTHELACRLLPGLPRRGLRALAGRLGSPLGEVKRAAEHVRATAVVWRELSALLDREHGVATLEDLRAWCQTTRPRRRGGRDFAVPREVRLDLPETSGVYRMLGRSGEVLYLGKATSIRRRVNAYFQKRRHQREQTLEMLTQTWALDVTPTETPLEAALLESDEIKEHQPPYNVALRDQDAPLLYADAGLRSVRTSPGLTHRLGPFPRREPLDCLLAVRDALTAIERRCEVEAVRRALALPTGDDLPEAAAREGLEALRHGFGQVEGLAGPGLHVLLGQGARLWRAWLSDRAARASANEAEEPDGEAGEQEQTGAWTAQRVRLRLEEAVRRGTHLLRRAHWLTALSESSLVWRPTGSPSPARARLLVVERGQVTRAQDVAFASPPLPPGWPRAVDRRLESLDRAAYDRLRVLTTELRRLVQEHAPVEVCLGPRRRLGSAGLVRRLRWI